MSLSDNPIFQLLVGSNKPPRPIPPNASLALRYELWLRDNQKVVLPLLDGLRTLTVFLPGRFQPGGQLSSEGIYTLMNVIQVYHESILDKPRAITAEVKINPESKTHKWLKILQGILIFSYYTEVFVEMAAKRFFKDPANCNAVEGQQTRGSWWCIAAVEAIKAFCRLNILYVNRGRMLTPPTQDEMILDHMASIRTKQKDDILRTERLEYEHALVKQQQQKQLTHSEQKLLTAPSSSSSSPSSALISSPPPYSSSSSISSPTPLDPSSLPPGSSFSSHAQPGHLPPLLIQNLIDTYIKHGRQTSSDTTLGRPHGRFVIPIPHPHDHLSYRPPVQHIISEILHILRPVIYTFAHVAHSSYWIHNSWTPIILSIIVDGTSRALAPRMSSLSLSEFEEVSSRLRKYLFYLLRDPIFSSFVAAPLQRFSELMGRIPLIGTIFSGGINIIFAIQKYYFYTAASS